MSDFAGPRASDGLALCQLISDYCYELDLTGGINAYCFFTPEGRLDVGTMTIAGRDEMKSFYANLVKRVQGEEPGGARTTRHVASNIRIEFKDDDHAHVAFIAMNYSSSGRPPIFGGTIPTVISDALCVCERGADGKWLIAEFTGTPIFIGDDPLQRAILTGQ